MKSATLADYWISQCLQTVRQRAMNRAERRRRTIVKLHERVRLLKRQAPSLTQLGIQGRDQPRHTRQLLGYRGSPQEIGKCRRKHPFDCGRPRCGVCSWDKRYGRTSSRQERITAISEAEWLAEYQGLAMPRM